MMATQPKDPIPPCAACGHYLLHPVHEQKRDDPRLAAQPLTPMDLKTRYYCRNCGTDRTTDWENAYGWA